MKNNEFKKIAVIRTDMKEKFGIPKQSGTAELKGKIVFEKEYRRIEAVRGLEGFSHIWILWRFDGFDGGEWSPTVRPPKLGGNRRVGVFATRSPNRPNPIGLSSVKLDKIDLECGDAPVLFVSGVDMTDGTEIYDIKPYLPLSDCISGAKGGFTETIDVKRLNVVFEDGASCCLDEDDKNTVIRLLENDPRPGYADDPERVYGMKYKNYDIKFKVSDNDIMVTGVL